MGYYYYGSTNNHVLTYDKVRNRMLAVHLACSLFHMNELIPLSRREYIKNGMGNVKWTVNTMKSDSFGYSGRQTSLTSDWKRPATGKWACLTQYLQQHA